MLPLNSDLVLPFPARILTLDYHASSGAEPGLATVAMSLVPIEKDEWRIHLFFTGVRELTIAKIADDGIHCALFEISDMTQSPWRSARFEDVNWMVGDFKTDSLTFFARTAEVTAIERTTVG